MSGCYENETIVGLTLRLYRILRDVSVTNQVVAKEYEIRKELEQIVGLVGAQECRGIFLFYTCNLKN